MDKAELRQKLLKIKVGKTENKKISEVICDKFLVLNEYKKAKCVFCYVGKASEIDTLSILNDVLKSGKILCVPYCTKNQKGEKIMQARQIKAISELKIGAYGILEPSENAKVINSSEIDIIAVPCLAADIKGARLGYGAGYYDKFLTHTRNDVEKVVLCRDAFLQEIDVIPMQIHDIRMDIVITESICNFMSESKLKISEY